METANRLAHFVLNVCRISATLSCPMKLQKYPLDTQVCPLMFESCKYSLNYSNYSEQCAVSILILTLCSAFILANKHVYYLLTGLLKVISLFLLHRIMCMEYTKLDLILIMAIPLLSSTM